MTITPFPVRLQFVNPEDGSPVTNFTDDGTFPRLLADLLGLDLASVFPASAETSDWNPDMITSYLAMVADRVRTLSNGTATTTETEEVTIPEDQIPATERDILPKTIGLQDGVVHATYSRPVSVAVPDPDQEFLTERLAELTAFIQQGRNGGCRLRNLLIAEPVEVSTEAV